MAAAYTEPSPNLCALVWLLSGCNSPFVQAPKIFTASFAEKSRPPSPDGAGDGACMDGWRMPAFLFAIRYSQKNGAEILLDASKRTGRHVLPLPHQWNMYAVDKSIALYRFRAGIV